MKRWLLFVCIGSAVALGSGLSASATKGFTQATGGILMSTPSQSLSFNVFDYGPSSPLDHGTVTYTNFEYPGGLSYTATVLCATVDTVAGKATFAFQIPAGFPGLSGLYVVASVSDGGSSGATNDTYGHTATADPATAMSWCENSNAPVANYPITAGNLVVH